MIYRREFDMDVHNAGVRGWKQPVQRCGVEVYESSARVYKKEWRMVVRGYRNDVAQNKGAVEDGSRGSWQRIMTCLKKGRR